MLFEDIESTVEPLPEPVPPRQDYWLVLAWDRGWTVPSILRSGGGLYLTREAAVKAAESLASVWKNKQIVHIPGAEGG